MKYKTKMFEMAKQMLPHSYSPYSKFKVSCCLRTNNDNFYTGCNVENASYSLACCAETNAILQMVAHGEQEIAEMVIISESDTTCVPCGACRQRIREFAMPELPIHMGTHKGLTNTQTLHALLPNSFGPEYLS
ncbi:MAG: cytidine deaminase [Legionellales bacterium]|nr:cytidine deaminase [Legionellales bacterium]|tara:strand:- start:1191 stop:1589 length:399 start_codon:yes stop_codon:yes gene_type:complete